MLNFAESLAFYGTATGGGNPNVFRSAPLPAVFAKHQRSTPEPKTSEADEITSSDYAPPPSRERKRKSGVEDTRTPVTNVLLIKFRALSKPCKVHSGDPVICSNEQCAAILNHHSKITQEDVDEGKVRY